MGSSVCRTAALASVVLAIGACDADPPFRSLTVSMRVTKAAEDPGTSTVFASAGPIVTGDPDLVCKLRSDARPRSSTIECVRTSTEESVSASFSCPETGSKSGSTVGWLVVNSPKPKLSHSFSADCAYGK